MFFSMPVETQLWGSLQCHEAISLILYAGLALLLVLYVPRWLRGKIDYMFLKAVCRKAREKHKKELERTSMTLLCPGGGAVYKEHYQSSSGVGQDKAAVVKDEIDDPDYLAVRDDGYGDYPVKPNASFVSGRYHI